jgi:hypothetical protein
MNNYILKYIDQGFVIFPCSIDKTPLTRNGFYDATNDLALLQKQFYKIDLFIGFPTGSKNGICVIDFDVNKKIPGTNDIDTRSVDELIEEVRNNYGELPDTFQVETPSGGRHFYYLMPDMSISSANRFIDKYLPIDIKADGGYAIAPDGINYRVYDDVDEIEIDNLKSRCVVLPEWIQNLRIKRAETVYNPENLPETVLPPEEVREIRSALSFINSDDRDMWVKIGMSLKSTNSPSSYGLWDEWSKLSPKYKADDMGKRWATLKPKDVTIASLFHVAKQAGWVTTYEKKSNQQVPAIHDNPLTEQNIKNIQAEFKKKPFPTDLLQPQGLVGDIMQYILEKSIMEQPIFALAAALCAVGTLAGRKVQTETGVRTNLYCLNVGGSGSGKEAPRKAIKNLFQIAGCGEMASVEDLASDAAIITAFKSPNESQLFLLDEIGRFLESTRKGATHLYNVVSVLLKMYSSANQVYYGKNYADEDKKTKIVQPNLCLLGSTVPDVLYKGLNYESATDGFLSRMLIFETDNNRPRKNRRKHFLNPPAQEIIDKIKALKRKPINIHPDGNIEGLTIPKPQIVPINENANTMLDEFDNYIYDLRDELEKKNKIESIYCRTSQLAEQIALIIATGVDIDNPVISEKEMAYGISLAKYLGDQLQFVVENYMAKNDMEHEVKHVLNIIRVSGQLSLSEISKKTQNLPGHVRNDIIETLKNSDQIHERIVGQGIYATRMFSAM